MTCGSWQRDHCLSFGDNSSVDCPPRMDGWQALSLTLFAIFEVVSFYELHTGVVVAFLSSFFSF